MVTRADQIRAMGARPIVHDFREPDFVWDGRIVPPCPALAGVVQGLVRNSFVGSIVASYYMYRLPEPIPWLLVATGARGVRAMVIGPRTRIELDSLPPWTTSMCAAVFHPGALGPLLGVPAAELADVCVDLADVLGERGRALCRRLEDAGSPDEQLVVVEEAVLALARAASVGAAPPSVQIAQAASRGASVLRLADLERLGGWSQRSLRRQFQRDVGLSPKRYLRLLRFAKVIAHLRGPRRADWRDLALAVGYADQAHLITEFREFTGLTPTAFLAEPAIASTLRHGAVPRPRPQPAG